jgi:tetratricopeptide (TPR) repeat protein
MTSRGLLILLAACGSAVKPVAPPRAEPVPEPSPRIESITVVPRPSPEPSAVEPTSVNGQPPALSDAELQPIAAGKPTSRKTQADIAATLNHEGSDLLRARKFELASAKYREAVARVPEPAYFFNLCLALYAEGKYSEALSSCDAASNSEPGEAVEGRTRELRDRILVAAKRQGISTRP